MILFLFLVDVFISLLGQFVGRSAVFYVVSNEIFGCGSRKALAATTSRRTSKKKSSDLGINLNPILKSSKSVSEKLRATNDDNVVSVVESNSYLLSYWNDSLCSHNDWDGISLSPVNKSTVDNNCRKIEIESVMDPLEGNGVDCHSSKSYNTMNEQRLGLAEKEDRSWNDVELDCEMKHLALLFAQSIQPDRFHIDGSTNNEWRQVLMDALQYDLLCGTNSDRHTTNSDDASSTTRNDQNKNQLRHHPIQQPKQRKLTNVRDLKYDDTIETTERLVTDEEPVDDSLHTNVRSACDASGKNFCIFVDPLSRLRTKKAGKTDHNLLNNTDCESVTASFRGVFYSASTLYEAVHLSRNCVQDPYHTVILFRAGVVHTVVGPDNINGGGVLLGPEDSGLTLMGEFKDSGSQSNSNKRNLAWLSGSIPIPDKTIWEWDCNLNLNVRIANVSDLLLDIRNEQQQQKQQQKKYDRRITTNDDEEEEEEEEDREEESNLLSLSDLFEWPQLPSLFVFDAPCMYEDNKNNRKDSRRTAEHHDSLEKPIAKRAIRARYPNMDPELNMWGYNSPNLNLYALSLLDVVEWHRPLPGVIPSFVTYDFRPPHISSIRQRIADIPYKNDSTMDFYNVYTTGYGGVCDDVWGTTNKYSELLPSQPSYWCSNVSDGGWAEVDRECAITGQLQIPNGMTINGSSSSGQHFFNRWWGLHGQQTLLNNLTSLSTQTSLKRGNSGIGGIVHVWHSQSWSMHMFTINGSSLGYENETTNQSHGRKENNNESVRQGEFINLTFAKGGGRQGARNWCRCDQCTYAGNPYCGQYSDENSKDNRLISGPWLVENILSELDSPGEYYLDHETNLLYYYPNHTESSKSINRNSTDTSDDNGLKGLRLGVFDTILRIVNGSDITITNLGFRETSATYMNNDWVPPSGGDWSLHRSGAVFLENVTSVSIVNCTFERIDNNAVFLSRRTRNITISGNVFEWLGENAIALWGDTLSSQNGPYDATGLRNYPIGTLIENNLIREIGIYQKQSAGVAHNIAALTTIRNNVMFNVPRAAINFNDMMGGGDIVENNLLFNTCRESGDHGPINTWDRQPMLSDLSASDDSHNANDTTFLEPPVGEPSFTPFRRRLVQKNFLFANYNAAQGVDNDDGSSWYYVRRNVFYDSIGIKMDYGGHDSIYEENIILMYPKSNTRHQREHLCVNFATFYPGHGHIVRRNKCFVSSSITNSTAYSANNTSYEDTSTTHHNIIIALEQCNQSNTFLYNNTYYLQPFTVNGTVNDFSNVKIFECGYDEQNSYTLTDIQKEFGLEFGSTIQETPPSLATISSLVVETLLDRREDSDDLKQINTRLMITTT